MATVTLPTEIQPRSPQGGFANEPFVDFKAPENARAMKAALDLVAGAAGPRVRPGDRRATAEDRGQDPVARIRRGRRRWWACTRRPARSTRSRRWRRRCARLRSWSRTPVEERVSLLLSAAEIIRERKFEFCAWLTYEVGKNWAEADADVARDDRLPGVLRARGAAAGAGDDADSVCRASAMSCSTFRWAWAR